MRQSKPVGGVRANMEMSCFKGTVPTHGPGQVQPGVATMSHTRT